MESGVITYDVHLFEGELGCKTRFFHRLGVPIGSVHLDHYDDNASVMIIIMMMMMMMTVMMMTLVHLRQEDSGSRAQLTKLCKRREIYFLGKQLQQQL